MMHMSTEKDEEDQRRGKALARSQTDPLYLQDHFLFSGHDKNTRNATATFVQFEGKQYVVTCRHVVEVVKKRKGRDPRERYPTLALVVGRAIINLSLFTAEGMQYSLRTPEPDEGEEPLDLAIADISSRWKLLVEGKGKTTIDLDNWREPRWARAEMMLAAGYPDEHKESFPVDQEVMVGSPFVTVAARKKGEIGRNRRFAEMHSRLDEPHGYYFSGMSGGPIYVVQDDIII
jgi:hypothetical protein